ncbi:hypothetical protein CR513_47732, partial [Mucuna pruriens]
MTCPKPAGCIEDNEEALETDFQSLKVANTTLAMGANKRSDLNPLRAAAKIMINKGYKVGKGLQKNLDGITRPIQIRGNQGKPVEEEADHLEESGPKDYVHPCPGLTGVVNWVVFDAPPVQL